MVCQDVADSPPGTEPQTVTFIELTAGEPFILATSYYTDWALFRQVSSSLRPQPYFLPNHLPWHRLLQA